MPTPTSGGTFSVIPATGVTDIDALISTTRWGVGSSSPTVITYSFPGYGDTFSIDPTSGYGPSSGAGHPWNGFAPLTTYQQQQVRAVLQSISNVANVVFQEVADNATSAGDIRYAFSSSVPASVTAQAFTPGGSYSLATNTGTANAKAGDIWIRSSIYQSFNPVSGSFDYTVLLHETMHALGLKHPFEAGETGVVLPADRNVIPMTLMSYDEGPGTDSFLSVYPTQPMPLDVRALQFLYGANRSANAGDNTYTQNTDNPTWLEIWDTGGNDTIVLSGYHGAILDLQPNSWSEIGNGIDIGYTSTWAGTLYIEPNVTIENAIGGSGNDTITGNDANNTISGGPGNDILYGGAGADNLYGDAGNDSLISDLGNDFLNGGAGNDMIDGGTGIDFSTYTGNRSNFTVTKSGTGFIVTDNVGTNGRDTLNNIERLSFANGTLGLDTSGTSGQMYRLYKAAFDRVPDAPGLGHNIRLVDGGLALAQMSAAFVASAEFVSTYGALSNAQFINQLYLNVLDRTPDAPGLAHNLNLLNTILTRANMLAAYSESAENQLAVIGQIQNGIWFT